MIGKIDIENAKTKKVTTLIVPIIEKKEKELIKFDISKLSKDKIDMITLAISEKKETSYIDIELFFIDDNEIPYFGPDYNFYIKDDSLVGVYNRIISVK